MDGNKWCALYGEDLQSGCCGFGDSPEEAMDAFDVEWKSAARAERQTKLHEEARSKDAAQTRTDTATSRYVVSENGGTVFDNETGLTWQREVSDKEYTHAEALGYAKQLRLGEHDDWRLPTVQEFLRLVDYTKLNPAIDVRAFPDTPSEWFWASSPYARYPSSAWVVYFYNGSSGNDGTTSTYWVRCVR
jgi:hypothetical protein